MYHTTGPVTAVQCGMGLGIAMPCMSHCAEATDVEPSANATAAAPPMRIRMVTAFRERPRAKRKAPARYCRLAVARRRASLACSTAAAIAAPSPLAYARDTSGNATLA
jgi:hypothetical protein